MAFEHQPPTNSVVKQLYARAFTCAFPSCNEPLFREDPVSGTWVLNSRICHICARSEGGPRWDAHQTSERNRSVENLVLMCIAHASVIDDPLLLHSYPAELLRTWKEEQLAEHQRRREGWPITSKVADEALLASKGATISIRDSIVHLGGEGGRVSGAGGGGGGAIGDGARAGRGGNGGRITDADGKPLPPEELEYFLISGGIPAPGSGGGGGGAVGPGAIGGDGGDGGDGMSFTVEVQPGDVFVIEIGEGGKSTRQPGQHPSPGGDTVLRHRTAAGELIREYRVAGGKSAKSGRLPDDWATITAADLEGGFQVSTLMPFTTCDFYQGRLHILGGAWEAFNVPQVPYDAAWPIICIVGWEKLEPGHMRGLQICLTNPSGEEVSRIAVGLPQAALSGLSYIWPVMIGATFDCEGFWGLHVQSGKYLLSRILIRISVEA